MSHEIAIGVRIVPEDIISNGCKPANQKIQRALEEI